MTRESIVVYCAKFLELAGVLIIAGTAVYASVLSLYTWRENGQHLEGFHRLRTRLAAGILLGLEFLVAADIINSVAVDLTLSSVGTLAVIVLIRTFLSFTLSLEVNGRFPWQAPRAGKDA